jgi:CheY-like chemotaxis protein
VLAVAAATAVADTIVHSAMCYTDTIHQMGGKEAAAIIRQQDPHVPIIFLTGEIAATMKESTISFAPAYLLLKPCNKLSLIAVSVLSNATCYGVLC